MALDIREMTFQNVIDTVLKPAGVKVGGFPEELFLDLTETEKETLTCGICFLIVNDCRQCDNKHLFCHTCIFAWTMTYGENSQKCPMCRCEQTDYAIHKEVNRNLENKRVKCLEEGCTFRSPLKIYLMHSHGKQKHSNAHVNFDNLRPPRQQVLLLPGIVMQPGGTRAERAAGIRSQLQQGRVMIHQMMMLLHLEMQLRQQALVSYQEAQDPVLRIRRLDEVLALNEQLNEVGGILSGLLTTPFNRMSSTNESSSSRQAEAGVGGLTDLGMSLRNGLAESPSRISGIRGLMNHGNNSDDDSSSDSSDASGVISTARRDFLAQRERNASTNTQPSTSVGVSTSSNPTSSLLRPRRRSEIRDELQGAGASSTPPATPEPIPEQRRPLTLTRSREPARSVSRQGGSTSVSSTTVQRLAGTASDTTTPTTRSRDTSMSLPQINNSPRGVSQTQSSNQTPPSRAINVRSRISDVPSEVAADTEDEDAQRGHIPQGSSALRRVMQGMGTSSNNRQSQPSRLGQAGTSSHSGRDSVAPSESSTRTPSTPLPTQQQHRQPVMANSVARHRSTPVQGAGAGDTRISLRENTTLGSRNPPNTNSSVSGNLPRRSISDQSSTSTTRGSTNQSQTRIRLTTVPGGRVSQARGNGTVQQQISSEPNQARGTTQRNRNTTQPPTRTTTRNPNPPSSSSSPTTSAVDQQAGVSRGPRAGAPAVAGATSRRRPSNVMQNPAGNGSESSALPTTPGQLMRARRRSEISQQLMYRNNDEDE